MKCYVVVDTNVIVAALLSKHEDSATVQVLNRLFGDEVKLLYSNGIEKEYEEVLRRPKFKFSKVEIDDLLGAIRHYGILVHPRKTNAVLPDMRDLPFFELVLEKREDNAYLVTGNIKHFPKEPFVVTPRELLEILDGSK